MKKKKTILIAGGGTGGHLFPGIAVADAFKAKGYDIFFVGTKIGIETKIVPAQGYSLYTLLARGVKGRSIFARILALLILPISIVQAVFLLIKIKPRLVIGVGGYASFSMLCAAVLLRKKTAILEQNTIPGIANRILGKFVQNIFTSFAKSEQFFPKEKILCTGNPIRSTLKRKEYHQPSYPLRILALGGSQGAHGLNQLVLGAVKILCLRGKGSLFTLVHQSGSKDVNWLTHQYQELQEKEGPLFTCQTKSFIEDMNQAYFNSDLVLSRAGATTIAEITYAGLPSILIPYPFASDDHQRWNALALVEQNAARLTLEQETTEEKLADMLQEYIEKPYLLVEMARESYSMGKANATEAIVHFLEKKYFENRGSDT